jgi:hypothetical protein
MAKTKQYRVSIACSIPINFEWEGKAKTEKEAFKLAMEEADDNLNDGLDEESLDYGEAEMIKGIKNEKSDGVYIEEVEE